MNEPDHDAALRTANWLLDPDDCTNPADRGDFDNLAHAYVLEVKMRNAETLLADAACIKLANSQKECEKLRTERKSLVFGIASAVEMLFSDMNPDESMPMAVDTLGELLVDHYERSL